MIELVASDKQRKFGQDKKDSLPRYCRECDVSFICNGECPKNRFMTTPDGEPGLNYLCAGFKLFFKHADPAMRVMANMLRQGRQAGEIMQLNTSQGNVHNNAAAKVGRNDPCPCGSGKKFKHCHGSTGADTGDPAQGKR